MCGIAGWAGLPDAPPDEGLLDRMADALAHRGPDGRGRYGAGDVGMRHNRLSIIDLETGDQPIENAAGVALVANAEIYNYLELRAEFEEGGAETKSDCETPLRTYRAVGRDFAAPLRGMYALALHDRSQRLLALARDPFGIKPLYYAQTARGLAFASEPRAFFQSGVVDASLVPQTVDELLALQFTTGAETIFKGVSRVLPGETIFVSGGRIVERRRLSSLPTEGPVARDESDALGALDRALTESVDVHQRSDVPYGMFLSGGIDSSALLAVMRRLNERPVRAFTAGFADTSVPDERAQARAVAEAAGAEHIEVEFTENDFWTLLPAVARALDDPAADYATLPTYKLGKIAGQDLKVVLCGEGGDELFAGYGRYRSARRPWWRGGSRQPRRRGWLEGLGVLRQETAGWRDGIGAAESVAARPERSPLQVAQAADCAEWLAHDLLLKVDRCLMAHGVEGRTPFLDPIVAQAAFTLPDHLKIRGRHGKWLLRRWLEKHLPAAMPFARKRGFTVPVGAWIARRGVELGAAVAAQPGVEAICTPSAVHALFASTNKRALAGAWILLFYALWHQQHLCGAPAGGTITETLREAA
jgi:asparagine synthase (glutamine-hydrolysing)